MRKQTRFLFIFFVAFSICAPVTGIQAAPYYEGKRLKILVGFSPGEAMIAWPGFLQSISLDTSLGNPRSSSKIWKELASILAANHTYNIAKPDGLDGNEFRSGTLFCAVNKGRRGEIRCD